jgi:hypothetical protein
VVKAAPIIAPAHPDLLRRRKRLLALEEERKYQRMARAVEGKKKQGEAPLNAKSGRRVFSLVLNLLVTMAACFAFGWYGSQFAFPNIAIVSYAGFYGVSLLAGGLSGGAGWWSW